MEERGAEVEERVGEETPANVAQKNGHEMVARYLASKG